MALPLPNLDDRTYADLVEEARPCLKRGMNPRLLDVGAIFDDLRALELVCRRFGHAIVHDGSGGDNAFGPGQQSSGVCPARA